MKNTKISPAFDCLDEKVLLSVEAAIPFPTPVPQLLPLQDPIFTSNPIYENRLNILENLNRMGLDINGNVVTPIFEDDPQPIYPDGNPSNFTDPQSGLDYPYTQTVVFSDPAGDVTPATITITY